MKKTEESRKVTWSPPVVIDLDETVADVENGFATGTDGGLGASTSMS